MAFTDYCGIIKLIAILAILGVNAYDPMIRWVIRHGRELGISKDFITLVFIGLLIYAELVC